MAIEFSTNSRTSSLLVSFGVLVSILAVQGLIILSLNDGFFTYTLDDPYIHLALAENLLHGHYGVNAGEYSAASSSILWPFLLAPFSPWRYSPFVLNVLCALATLTVFSRFLQEMRPLPNQAIAAMILCVLLFANNLVGLTFMGMEHTLQVLAVAFIALGLVQYAQHRVIPIYLLVFIVLAPLVRYENLAISVAALLFLLLRRQYKIAIAIGLVLLLALSLFSVFLMKLGLGYLPSSVMAKNAVVQMDMQASTFLLHLQTNLTYRSGLILLATDLALVVYSLLPKMHVLKRQLAICTAVAISLHLLVGRTGWYNRYEIYIGTFALLIGLFLVWEPCYASIREKRWVGALAFAPPLFAVIYLSVPYTRDLLTLPVAANNVYEQHYQMHRFATQYFRTPVAVNDLGYVAYRNSQYVLDLWGLGSLEALERRLLDDNYLEELPTRHDVGLAMIYETWFPNIPSNWEKVAVMGLSRTRITPAEGQVTFFVIDARDKERVLAELNRFAGTLPTNVPLQILQ